MNMCERCAKRGVENPVSRVLTIADELPDGALQLSNSDAFTMGLCLACASEIQRTIVAAT